MHKREQHHSKSFFKNSISGKISLGLLAALFLTGCDQAGQQAAAPGAKAGTAAREKKKIAAILMQDDQFFRLNELGMKRTAQKHGVELFTGSSNGALDKEINLVDTYAARGVDAILVAPLNPKGSAPAIKRALQKGIKVVTYDGMVDAAEPTAAISSDQVSLGATTGRAMADYIRNKMNGKAKIALIEFLSLSVGQGPLRPKGFKDEIKKLPGVQIVAEQDAWLAPQAEKVVTDILNAHPEVNAIWAANEGGTVGAVMAVKNAGKAGKVVVFGTDMSEQLAGFLLSNDNILQAVTAQKPLEMGTNAVETALKATEGQPVQKKTVLTGTLYKRGDVAAINAFKKTAAQATR